MKGFLVIPSPTTVPHPLIVALESGEEIHTFPPSPEIVDFVRKADRVQKKAEIFNYPKLVLTMPCPSSNDWQDMAARSDGTWTPPNLFGDHLLWNEKDNLPHGFGKCHHLCPEGGRRCEPREVTQHVDLFKKIFIDNVDLVNYIPRPHYLNTVRPGCGAIFYIGAAVSLTLVVNNVRVTYISQADRIHVCASENRFPETKLTESYLKNLPIGVASRSIDYGEVGTMCTCSVTITGPARVSVTSSDFNTLHGFVYNAMANGPFKIEETTNEFHIDDLEASESLLDELTTDVSEMESTSVDERPRKRARYHEPSPSPLAPLAPPVFGEMALDDFGGDLSFLHNISDTSTALDLGMNRVNAWTDGMDIVTNESFYKSNQPPPMAPVQLPEFRLVLADGEVSIMDPQSVPQVFSVSFTFPKNIIIHRKDINYYCIVRYIAHEGWYTLQNTGPTEANVNLTIPSPLDSYHDNSSPELKVSLQLTELENFVDQDFDPVVFF